MTCENCIDHYSSFCIDWQGDKTLGNDLHTIVKKLTENNADLDVDMKILSTEDDLNESEIIQILIDNILQLRSKVTQLSSNTNIKTIDCSISLNGIPSNNICTILTYIMNEINTLKLEVNNLKNNNEYL